MADGLRDYQNVINGRYVYALEAFVAELAQPNSVLKPSSMKLSEIMNEFLNLVLVDFAEAKCYDPGKQCWDHRLSREFSERLGNAIELVKKFESGQGSKDEAQDAVDEAYMRLKEMSRHFFFYQRLLERKRLEPKENP